MVTNKLNITTMVGDTQCMVLHTGTPANIAQDQDLSRGFVGRPASVVDVTSRAVQEDQVDNAEEHNTHPDSQDECDGREYQGKERHDGLDLVVLALCWGFSACG